MYLDRDIKNLTGHSPGQSALSDHGLSRGAGLSDLQTSLPNSTTL